MLKDLPIKIGLAVIKAISKLPLSVINRIGFVLGNICYHILKNRRNVGLVNLKLCFPEWSDTDRDKLIRAHFRELFCSGLAYGLIFDTPPNRMKELIKLNGMEHVHAHKNRPVILLAPHFLALDIGANRMTLDTAGYSIYSAQRSEYLTQEIKKARLRFIKDKGGEIFSRQEGLKNIVRKMKTTHIPFYYLPDQDMDERNSAYVPFFAHPNCATLDILPKLAKLTDAVILPVATYREGNQYIVEISPALENYPTGDITADVATMNKCIENMIMKHPAQYLWLHKRFKTQPNLPRGILYKDC